MSSAKFQANGRFETFSPPVEEDENCICFSTRIIDRENGLLRDPPREKQSDAPLSR